MSTQGRTLSDVRDITQVTALGGLANVVLAGAKIAAGIFGQSQALVADGIHSFSDLASDAVVYWAAKSGSRGPDSEHPYGHARIETAATVAMGALLILVAAGIVWDAVERLRSPETLAMPGAIALWMAVFSVLVKEGMYHYTLVVARRVKSDLLRANAWHHRSDAASSVIVVMAVGGALAGWTWLDAVGAIAVALMIAWIGWEVAQRSVRELVDVGLDPERVEGIRQSIMAVDGVKSLHLLRTRRMGGKALVDVHIMLEDPRISVSEGHQISEAVRLQLVDSIDEITDVTVHIDPEDDERFPVNPNLPLRSATLDRLRERWSSIDAGRQIKHVTLHYLDGKIHLEVLLPASLAADADALSATFTAAVKEERDIGEVRLRYG